MTEAIERLIAASGADAVAVGFCDLGAGEEWYILPDEPFHAASTMKVCVIMELFHQAALGSLNLSDPIMIRNEFPSLVDGSPFSVGIEDDSEQALYGRLGETETLLGLAWPMITHSSNLATNLLVDRLGAERITAFMSELGAPNLKVLRGVEDGKAWEQGLNNTVTARDLTRIMTRLGRGQVVSPEASEVMLEILFAQTYRSCIPAGLPPDFRIANKTGWNSVACHDCAVVFPAAGRPFALTVLTRGLDERTTGSALIKMISKTVYGRS